MGESFRVWEEMHREWVKDHASTPKDYIPLIELCGAKIANYLEE